MYDYQAGLSIVQVFFSLLTCRCLCDSVIVFLCFLERFVGRTYSEIVDEVKTFPFSLSAGENDSIKVSVEYKGENATYSVEEIASFIISRIRDTASQYLGVEVSNCVLSVNAHATDAIRAALCKAASLANLNVLALVSEPIAACMAHDLDEPNENDSYVAVIDCGATETKVSVISINDGIMQTVVNILYIYI